MTDILDFNRNTPEANLATVGCLSWSRMPAAVSKTRSDLLLVGQQ